MRSRPKTLIGLLLGGALLIVQGCALTTGNLDLAYKTDPGRKSPLGTLSPMKIALQVTDERPAAERDAVGNKRNGYGMVTAAVKSNKDVLLVVSDALKSELASNGHAVVDSDQTSSDVLIRVGLKRYWTDVSIHFWDIEVIGTFNADVAIGTQSPDKPLLTKPMQSAFRESRQIATEGAYESVLNGALGEFIRNFARDPSVIKALQSVRQPPGQL